jgi:hypothetical protein
MRNVSHDDLPTCVVPLGTTNRVPVSVLFIPLEPYQTAEPTGFCLIGNSVELIETSVPRKIWAIFLD